MAKYNAENERLKREYEYYPREAKGQDVKSVDKARAAISKFEQSTKFKPFRSFHIEQARQFKDALARAKNTKGQTTSCTPQTWSEQRVIAHFQRRTRRQ